MKLPAQWLSGAIAVIVAISLGSIRPAFADSYTVYNLGDDNSRGIYGIDTAGDVVIRSLNGCGVALTTCYTTYVNGVATSESTTAPVLDYDDGTSCSAPAGFNSSKTICNGSWIGFGALYYPDGGADGVYLGSAADPTLIQSGTADQVFLNSIGDFAWTDGLDDEMFVAIQNPAPLVLASDLSVQQAVVTDPVPEPAALFLVGTGLLLFLAAIRRKVNRQPVTTIEG
jgi:hypothetical protein